MLDRSSEAVQHALATPSDSPSGHAVRREQAVLLADALEKLPAPYREVFILRNLEHVPFDEVAARMDGAIARRGARALETRHGSAEPVVERPGMKHQAPAPRGSDASQALRLGFPGRPPWRSVTRPFPCRNPPPAIAVARGSRGATPIARAGAPGPALRTWAGRVRWVRPAIRPAPCGPVCPR